MYQESLYVLTSGGQRFSFFGEFKFDKDFDDCMGTGTLRMPYDESLWAFFEPGFTELTIMGGTYDKTRLFHGRTRGIVQDGEEIEISLQDSGWKLKQTFNEQYDGDIIEVFKSLVKKAGMIPIIDLSYVPNPKSSPDERFDSDTGKVKADANQAAQDGTTPATPEAVTPATNTSVDSSIVKNRTDAMIAGSWYNDDIVAMPSVNGTCQYCGWTPKSSPTMFVNDCGNCHKNKLRPSTKFGGKFKNQVNCNREEGGCDCDFCGKCGRENIRGSSKKIVKTSVIPQSTNKTVEINSQQRTSTFEDELKRITVDWMKDNELLANLPAAQNQFQSAYRFYTNQLNQVVLIDRNVFQFMKDYKGDLVKHKIENWQIEYPSYKKDVSQFGYVNTVIVKVYKNGKATGESGKASLKDLVNVFGEISQVSESKASNKTEATKMANSELNWIVKDFAMETTFDMLWSGNITPGSVVTVTNPLTKNSEDLFVQGISVTLSPKDPLMASVNCLYDPKNTLIDTIPEVGTSKDATIKDAVSEKNAKVIAIQKEHQRFADLQKCNSCGFMQEKLGYGDCWADSFWLYKKLTDAGIPVRIVCCGYCHSSGGHRWIEINTDGTWKEWDYVAYHHPTHHHYGGSKQSLAAYNGCGSGSTAVLKSVVDKYSYYTYW